MKKIFSFTIILAALLVAGCGSEQEKPKVEVTNAGGPFLTVDKENHDFGKMAFGSDASCVFTISNTGDQPLILSECKATCGCTVPECNKEPIAPGETSEIKVTYDTKHKGPFNKLIKVYSNSTEGPEKMLRISGEVLPDENSEESTGDGSSH
ncbi:MAG: hypothetical protein RL220_1135 [Bacteroidota bacterium]|jgi:hypothetical protein